jgi:hypothetical protein
MKVGKVRVGEKVTLDDRGGVWEVIRIRNESGIVEMRCHFGSKENFGKMIEVSPDAFCFVHFEGPKPFGRDAVPFHPVSSSGTKIRIVDESDGEILDGIDNPTMIQMAAVTGSEIYRHTPRGQDQKSVYSVSNTAYDRDDDTYFILVMPKR